MHDPWTRTERGLLEGMVVPDEGGLRKKNWDNCSSVINKIYLKEEKRLMCHVLYCNRFAGAPRSSLSQSSHPEYTVTCTPQPVLTHSSLSLHSLLNMLQACM